MSALRVVGLDLSLFDARTAAARGVVPQQAALAVATLLNAARFASPVLDLTGGAA